jgi:hypothetical protein
MFIPQYTYKLPLYITYNCTWKNRVRAISYSAQSVSYEVHNVKKESRQTVTAPDIKYRLPCMVLPLFFYPSGNYRNSLFMKTTWAILREDEVGGEVVRTGEKRNSVGV